MTTEERAILILEASYALSTGRPDAAANLLDRLGEDADAVNLDGCTDDELRRVRKTGKSPALRMYARLALGARVHRRAGRIAQALEIERTMERIYAGLPESEKW